MIRATYMTMMLRLIRDSGALAMAFFLPALIYVIFASIFTGTVTGDATLRAAFLSQVENEETTAIKSALYSSDTLTFADKKYLSRKQLETSLRNGEIDAAIVQQAPISEISDTPPLVVIGEKSKPIAALRVAAELEQTIAKALPRALLKRKAHEVELITGSFTIDQKQSVESFLEKIPNNTNDSLDDGIQLITVETAKPHSKIEETNNDTDDFSSATYYSGAVAIMFLLFSSVQSALIILEEKSSGVKARLLLKPYSALFLTTGRFLFLLTLGTVQCTIILLIAAIFFGVPALEALGAVAIITLAAATASAGFGLIVVSFFSTAQQAHAASSFIVLIMSAVGGSMAPRYLMPEWLKTTGAYTPNAWAIDAYYQAIANAAVAERLAMPICLLLVFGIFTYLGSATIAYTSRH